MAALHEDKNLQYAGLAVVAFGFLMGALVGSGLEIELCDGRPSVARIGMLSGALIIVLCDLALRGTHEKARERLGNKRFWDPESGARIGRVIPAWCAGAVLALYVLQDGIRHGFC